MPEAAAIADRHDRPARRDAGDELRRRGGAAAVMRHEQHVAAQRARTSEHRRLAAALDVAGEEHRVLPRPDAQHAAQIVALRHRRARRMQELEAHAVPCPAVARLAASRSGRQRIERMRARQRRGERRDLESLEHRGSAADVVAILVAEHHEIEVRHALAAQRRHDDARAAVRFGAVRRTRVVEHAMVRRAHEHREALADVEGRDPSLAPGRA